MIRTLTLLLLLPSLSFGQDFPAPKPGEHHAVFEHDAGTWDCEMRMFLTGPNAAPRIYDGVEETRVVNRGLHLKTVFECRMGETTFVGHGLGGYDHSSGKYTGIWTDTFTSAPVRTVGTYDARTRTMTVIATVVDGEGKESKQKHVTKYGDGTKEFVIYMLAGDEEIRMMEMTCKRRKKK